jgi:hypothetical protein
MLLDQSRQDEKRFFPKDRKPNFEKVHDIQGANTGWLLHVLSAMVANGRWCEKEAAHSSPLAVSVAT